MKLSVAASPWATDTIKWVGAYTTDMGEELPLDAYRTGYIAERHGVTDNAAKALQLFEIGFSSSGVAKHLSVTEATVKKYKRELVDTIHENAPMPVGTKGRDGSLDVWGDRSVAQFSGEQKLTYADGVAHAQECSLSSHKQRVLGEDNERREAQDLPINRGIAIEDIPKELIGSRYYGEI